IYGYTILRYILSYGCACSVSRLYLAQEGLHAPRFFYCGYRCALARKPFGVAPGPGYLIRGSRCRTELEAGGADPAVGREDIPPGAFGWRASGRRRSDRVSRY